MAGFRNERTSADCRCEWRLPPFTAFGRDPVCLNVYRILNGWRATLPTLPAASRAMALSR